MRLVDTHCHLGDEAFKLDLSEVLERASAQGVIAIVSSATSLPEIQMSLRISALHLNFVFTSIGSDPTKLEPNWVETIRQTIKTNKHRIIGIGEVGLDYYWVKETMRREIQLKLFMEWMQLASELNLPLTVHSRNAGYESLKAISSTNARRVLMHAYDGKVGHAMEAAETGIFFSIPASVVYSEHKQKLARRLAIDNLVLETDAPVLSPSQGERNEPSNVIFSAQKIAEVKRMDLDTVAQVTSRNAASLFSLPDRA